MKRSMAFDTSSELLVQRYRNGVRLVRPSECANEMQTVQHFYGLPLSAYFYKGQNELANMNEFCAQLLNARSANDAIGKTEKDFLGKEFGRRVAENNHSIIRSAQFQIIEESGERQDDCLLKGISFKFPWYFENKIIGIFGCSLIVENNSLLSLSHSITSLVQAGLLTPNQMQKITRSNLNLGDVYLSTREMEVLKALAKGKRVKKIAEDLGISDRTVETHLVHIRAKLKLKDREDLVAFYWNLDHSLLGRPT